MPNAYVFPGGVTDKADMNKRWIEILNGCQETERPTSDLILKNVPRPLLLQNIENGILEKDLAFRIGAIRETFEEAGILLHKNLDGSKETLECNVLTEWRDKVRKDPSQFYTMCKHLHICPDIWSL